MAPHEHEDEDATAIQDRKQDHTPLPKLQLFIVFLIQFAEPVTGMVVYPFVNQLVRETGITGGNETKTGYYAGIIESTFFFSETCTVLAWGLLSDVMGRKPILLIGPLGLTLAMLGFGLSTSYWPLVYYRAFQGLFNGNIGVSKTVLAEITDSTNIGDAYALIPLMWGSGVTIGPAIGGVLSNAATRWPETLGKFSFFHAYPYFLPCAAAGAVAFSSFLFSAIAMKETIPASRKNNLQGVWRRFASRFRSKSADEARTALLSQAEPTGYGTGNIESAAEPPPPYEARPPLSDLFVPSFLITVFIYGWFAFTDMAVAALIPLVYSTPIEFGGLGMDPLRIGLIMAVSGLINGLLSALALGPVLRRYGPHRVFTCAILSYLVTFSAFPIANALARRAGGMDGYVIFVVVVQFGALMLMMPSYAAMSILVVHNAPSRRLLGSANGAAQMVTSGCRAMAPAFASSLFSLSIQHNIAGGNGVYIIFLGITLGLIGISRYLPCP